MWELKATRIKRWNGNASQLNFFFFFSTGGNLFFSPKQSHILPLFSKKKRNEEKTNSTSKQFIGNWFLCGKHSCSHEANPTQPADCLITSNNCRMFRFYVWHLEKYPQNVALSQQIYGSIKFQLNAVEALHFHLHVKWNVCVEHKSHIS